MSVIYYDRVVRGSEHEDGLVIVQFLKEMVGEKFSFLNYYKEMPVSYDAKLLSVENGMAEFEIHEYQAKVINIEKNVLIRAHEKNSVKDDMLGEAFYVNVSKRKTILTNFRYANIRSDQRRFVRVNLDGKNADVDLHVSDNMEPITASIKDISLGGIALYITELGGLEPNQEILATLKLVSSDGQPLRNVVARCLVANILGENPPYICIVEFHPEFNAQQALAHYINQRQVEIIKELKELADS